ncbi:hypothetical protein ACROYT_G022770 [Oculina patagonica]
MNGYNQIKQAITMTFKLKLYREDPVDLKTDNSLDDLAETGLLAASDLVVNLSVLAVEVAFLAVQIPVLNLYSEATK